MPKPPDPVFQTLPEPPLPADASPQEKLLGRIPTLSIIIPALNEANTIARIIRRVLAVEMPCRIEIILVDDGSTDATVASVQEFVTSGQIRLMRHTKRQGKGRALRTGFAAATGDFVICQDADEEYDPRDIPAVIAPLMDGRARASYGSRVINEHMGGTRRWTNPYWYGGRSLTMIANLLFPKCRISDEAVCYKAVRTDLLRTIPLRCTGFEFCPELTAKLSLRGERIFNVPIRYAPRSHAAGKKIRARHWFQAVWTMLKYRFSPDVGPVADYHPAPPSEAAR